MVSCGIVCRSLIYTLLNKVNVIYNYRHYSFLQDIKMIFATILGKRIEYAGEYV